MYSSGTGLVFGFHGCDRQVADDILNQRKSLKSSRNSYDWLGHGMYFWENSPARALEFAESSKSNPNRPAGKINEVAVIGAAIHLGNCLDLLDYKGLQLLRLGYDILKETFASGGKVLPQNKNVGSGSDLLLRELDCAVIEMLHFSRKQLGLQPFDSVRAAFWEGKELYPGAGFREKDHIQICVINPNCIRGFFKPREYDSDYPIV